MIGFSTAFHHREARCAKPQPMGPDKSNGGWEAEGAKTGHRPAAGLSDPLPKIPPTSPGFSKAHELDLAPWSLKKKRGLFSAPSVNPKSEACMAKLHAFFSNAWDRNGRLVWTGLAHSQKHPSLLEVLSGSSSFSLDLIGQGRSKRAFPAIPSPGGLVSSREMLLWT